MRNLVNTKSFQSEAEHFCAVGKQFPIERKRSSGWGTGTSSMWGGISISNKGIFQIYTGMIPKRIAMIIQIKLKPHTHKKLALI